MTDPYLAKLKREIRALDVLPRHTQAEAERFATLRAELKSLTLVKTPVSLHTYHREKFTHELNHP